MLFISRRLSSLLCLAVFLCGLFVASAGPALASWEPSHDDTTQLQGDYSIFPAVIGGVAGLAVGGAALGPVGALAGGISGFAMGNAIANHYVSGDNPVGPEEKINSGFMVNFLPGIAGAVAGLVITAGMGPLALMVGGATGFFLGKLLAKIMFPQVYYGGPVYERSTPTFRGRPSVSGTLNNQGMANSFMPASPVTEVDLSELKSNFYDSMHAYSEAMKTNDTEKIKSARGSYLNAQNIYFDAKRAKMQ